MKRAVTLSLALYPLPAGVVRLDSFRPADGVAGLTAHHFDCITGDYADVAELCTEISQVVDGTHDAVAGLLLLTGRVVASLDELHVAAAEAAAAAAVASDTSATATDALPTKVNVIVLVTPLEEREAAASSHGIQLTAHVLPPPPPTDDGSAPLAGGLLDVRISGVPVEGQASGVMTAGCSSTLLLLVVDQSGSMRPAWAQVQAMLNSVLAASFADPNVAVEVVLYNRHAGTLFCDASNYEYKIARKRANGGTCFAAMFEHVYAVVHGRMASASPPHRIAMMLFTDGAHQSCRQPRPVYEALRTYLHSLEVETQVHTLGFTSNSKFSELDRIRSELGTAPGQYMYAEPLDGPAVLKSKIEAFYGHVASSASRVMLTLQVGLVPTALPGTERCEVTLAAGVPSVHAVEVDISGSARLMLPIEATRPRAWLVPTPLRVSATVASASIDAEVAIEIPIAADAGAYGVLVASLQRSQAKLETLTQATAALTTSGDVAGTDREAAQLLRRVEKLSREFAAVHTNSLFRIARELRPSVLALRNTVADTLAGLERTLAEIQAQRMAVGRARLAELAHVTTFAQRGRQRRMTRRIKLNTAMMVRDAAALARLSQADAAELAASAPPDSLDLFACTLTLQDWTEVAEDKDVLGFGLTVTRPEFVVDDPTQIRIDEVTSTFVTLSAMEDALEYGVKIHGAEAVLGGFLPRQRGSNSATSAASAAGASASATGMLAGRGREPINAWLPLYLTPEHGEAALIKLKQALGFFVTLDPLGYHPAQVHVIFLVLGTMVARLASPAGERELRLVLAVQRTARAVALDTAGLYDEIRTAVAGFINSELDRSVCQVKNLFALIGYVLVLSDEDYAEIFPTPAVWNRFWLSLLRAVVRRGAYTLFANAPSRAIERLVDGLVDPLATYRESDDTFDVEAAWKMLASRSEDELVARARLPQLSAPYAESNRPALTVQYLDNRLSTKDELVLGAEVIDELVLDQLGFDGTSYEPGVVSIDMLALIAKFSGALDGVASGGYPTGAGLLQTIRYVTAWRALVDDGAALEEMDTRGGLAPEAWTEVLKEASRGDGSTGCTLAKFVGCLLDPVDSAEPSAPTGCSAGVQVLRAAVAQGTMFRVTRKARAGLANGTYASELVSDADRSLVSLASTMYVMKRGAIEAALGKLFDDVVRQRGVASTTTLKSFTTSLEVLLGSRTLWRTSRFTNMLPELMDRLCYEGGSMGLVEAKIAVLEKVIVLISGKLLSVEEGARDFTILPVLDNGVSWNIGRKNNNKLRRAFGVRLLRRAMRKVFLLDFAFGVTDGDIRLFDGTWDQLEPRLPWELRSHKE
ncbi:uncharacterized protein AMSG_03315 [Thecamonas trahens ATCC 50062]|uniref:VWFA domain-containing protein n=1 Tax=Thecamonas trahens ATCC 50062 TaxID=461836 RepID=A0A0L0D3K7_THETB|nr:hypothetical protein AMSG_03315 [Thecamonas trahens ATCC 50062]KNC46884.1 hypothetical protein AMSG_03315 [Thecamonas trahens ATCC 50062]|eukprot:XP_013760157.1 hypothetical protein AMSG_03315 [Thecamonas trahens ATCC 50062]